MDLNTIEKIREAIRRAGRHELDALSALYRIDNVLGEVDGCYELEFSDEQDKIMMAHYPTEEVA